MLEMWLVAPAQFVWNSGLAVSLDLDLVFSTNIHMILDTQVQLQTLYFSPSRIFANVRWKLVEPVLLYTWHLSPSSLSYYCQWRGEDWVPECQCCCGELEERLCDENWDTCKLSGLARHAISNKTISPISHAITLSCREAELAWSTGNISQPADVDCGLSRQPISSTKLSPGQTHFLFC